VSPIKERPSFNKQGQRSTATGTVATPDNVLPQPEQSQSYPIDHQPWENVNQLVNRNYQTANAWEYFAKTKYM